MATSAAAHSGARKFKKDNSKASLNRSFNSSHNSKSFNASLESIGSNCHIYNKSNNDFDDSLLSINERPSIPPPNRTRSQGHIEKSLRNIDQKEKTNNDDSFRINEASVVNVPSPSWMPSWLKPIDQGRRTMGRFINGDRFQYFILTLIMINAIMMGLATFPLVKENPQISDIFEIIDRVFLIIFTIESGLQLIYLGWYIFKDGFLIFDLLIVILSWALEGTQVIRAFRIFRALRLVTRVETMRNLVSAMFDVMPKLGAIFALMCLVFYIFGVMFTQLYKDLSKEGLDPMGYFSSLPNTLFTLFQIMCLDEWASVYETVSVYYWWSWIPFIAFIVITAFVVINLVVAVICDVVSDLDKEGQAGLYGFDSDEEFEMAQKRNFDNSAKKGAIDNRMRELQQKIETMVKMQDQMRSTTILLANKLRDSASCVEKDE